MDSDHLTISVIMPVYNGALFLREAIESILNQSFSDFEFIIINDGSTDDSKGIIREYELKDARIKFINQEQNSGLINVLNLGLSLSTGKYIARMDADDVSLPNRFASQAHFLDTHPEIGVLGSNVHSINSVGRRTSNFINNPRLPQTSNQIKWSLCFSCCLMHPTIMARRELLLNAGGYDKSAKHAEDYDLWVRLAPTTNFYNLPQKLLLLRRHETNITVIHIDTTIVNSRQISNWYISTILDGKISQELVDIFWMVNVQQFINQAQIITFLKQLKESFVNKFKPEGFENQYINKNIARRSIELLLNNHEKSLFRSLLFGYAFRIDPIQVISILIVKILRDCWKKLKGIL